MNNRIKEMVYAGLLTALAIIIPSYFGFLRIFVPPAFSATIAAHVPMMMAMLISPFVAAVVGVGSTLGFLMSGLPAPVVARAATHIVVGYIGAKIVMKYSNYAMAALITAPIHGFLEMIIVIPFIGITVDWALVVTLVGSIVHHGVDAVIAYVIVKAVAKARKKNIYSALGNFNEQVSSMS